MFSFQPFSLPWGGGPKALPLTLFDCFGLLGLHYRQNYASPDRLEDLALCYLLRAASQRSHKEGMVHTTNRRCDCVLLFPGAGYEA